MKIKIVLPFILGLFLVFFSCKKDGSDGPQYGTVTDIDGNEYKTIKIGDQEWMAENLRVVHYNTGNTVQDEIPLVIDNTQWEDFGSLGVGICSYYDKEPANAMQYGFLYNGYAVKSGKLAPVGWHVATKADWTKLQNYLIAHAYNYDLTNSGNKIAKSLASTMGWILHPEKGNVGNDQPSNNKTGFNGLPSGFRVTTGEFSDLGASAYWWTSTSIGAHSMEIFYLINDSPELKMNDVSLAAGMPVRCVKD